LFKIIYIKVSVTCDTKSDFCTRK